MKTFSKCLAIVLAVAGVATLAGCNKNTTSRKVATTANWNVRTSTSVEQDSFKFWQENAEVAKYAISFTDGSNASYKVSYNTDSAQYETKFYMTTYDWSAEEIPEGYRTEESETENIYVYETSLTISGTYELRSNGAKKTFEDELVTKSYFRPAGKNLQPVYSYQKIKNTSPATLTASSIDSAFEQVDEVYETFYNKGCSQATTIKTVPGKDGSTTSRIGLSSDYSNFDNSQLRAAIRAFTLSGGSSRTFYVVTPQNDNIQSVSASIGSPVELNPLDQTQALIINALKNAPEDYIFFDGTIANKQENQSDRNFRFNPVSLEINESLQGTTPTMWYSTVENNNVNSTRCVLLRMSTPLAFGLGTLNYTLKSLTLEEPQQS